MEGSFFICSEMEEPGMLYLWYIGEMIFPCTASLKETEGPFEAQAPLTPPLNLMFKMIVEFMIIKYYFSCVVPCRTLPSYCRNWKCEGIPSLPWIILLREETKKVSITQASEDIPIGILRKVWNIAFILFFAWKNGVVNCGWKKGPVIVDHQGFSKRQHVPVATMLKLEGRSTKKK